MSLAQDAFDALQIAKKMFGEYSYHDKGAIEVMDVDFYVREFRKLPPAIAAQEFIKLSEMEDTGRLVSDILCDLQDWDELFEADSRIGDLL